MSLPRICGAAVLAFLAPLSAAQAGVFALMGDMPYSEREIEPLRMIIDEISRDREVAFVVHDGDIKSGSEKCDNQRFLDAQGRFRGIGPPLHPDSR